MEMPPPENSPAPDVSLILRDFLRTIKAVCMYPANNSLPQSLRQSLSGRLLDLLEERGELRLSVDKAALLLNGEIVHRDKSKEDNLAAIFFSAGITELHFRAGLTVQGINRLLDSLRTYLTAPTGDTDMASVFWEANIDGFAFQTAEDIALSEYDVNFRIQEYFRDQDEKRLGDADQLESGRTYENVFLQETDLDQEQPEANADGNLSAGSVFDLDRDQAERLRAQAAAEAMGLTDLPVQAVPAGSIIDDERTIIENRQARIQTVLAEDTEFDLYESTSQLLIELLLQESTLKGFSETATICERTLSEYVRHGRLDQAAYLIVSLQGLSKRLRNERPTWAERLDDVHVTAGSRDRLHQVAVTLNERPDLPIEHLRAFLDVFDWQALIGISDLLGELEHRPHRETLCEYLVDRGRGKEEILARGIYDKRWYVVRNSVMVLGHIGDDRALQHLRHVLRHEDRRVRIELVASLRRKTSPKALDLLRELVYDPDEEIHNEAIQAIMAFPGPESFAALSELIRESSFASLDPQEQMALLVGYSILGQEQAVPYLVELINRYNPLRNPVLTFFRAAAFDALERNASEQAGAVLAEMAASWRSDIKQRAEKSVQRRRQLLGGEK